MNFFKKYVFNNYQLKLLSLLLAIFIWFAVLYVNESSMTVTATYSFNSLDKNLMVKKIIPQEITLTIKGAESILKYIKPMDIQIPIELARLDEGRHIFHLKQENIKVPKGIRIEKIKPESVTVELTRIIEKRLKTVVVLHKKWRGIYKIKSWYPHYVQAVGTGESLEDRVTIETVPVDGDFKKNEEEVEVPLEVKNMVLKKITPDTIQVTLRRN